MIGVDFILRGSAAGFTRAVATANNSLKSLKDGLKNFNVGNGLGGLIGVGGVVAGFRSIIGHAQELREELQKAGKPVDNMTRSVAELGDGFAAVAKSAKDFGVTALSYFTRAGEKAGDFLNGLRGISKEQAKINAETQKAADDAEASLAKSREVNSPQAVAAQRARNADAASKGSTGERTAYLLEQESRLRKEMERTGPQTLKYAELEGELQATINERKEIGAKLDKEALEAKEKINAEARKEVKLAEEADKKYLEGRAALVKQFAPSVEELAAQETGAFVAGDDPRLKARRVLQDEERARMLFSRGDVKGGLALAQQAQDTRAGLESMGNAGQGGYLTQQGAQDAFETALTKTNEELATLTEAVQGIIKAQK